MLSEYINKGINYTAVYLSVIFGFPTIVFQILGY